MTSFLKNESFSFFKSKSLLSHSITNVLFLGHTGRPALKKFRNLSQPAIQVAAKLILSLPSESIQKAIPALGSPSLFRNLNDSKYHSNHAELANGTSERWTAPDIRSTRPHGQLHARRAICLTFVCSGLSGVKHLAKRSSCVSLCTDAQP